MANRLSHIHRADYKGAQQRNPGIKDKILVAMAAVANTEVSTVSEYGIRRGPSDVNRALAVQAVTL